MEQIQKQPHAVQQQNYGEQHFYFPFQTEQSQHKKKIEHGLEDKVEGEQN